MIRSTCVEKALYYIEHHLRDNLNLEEIADVANYSPWHFHRLFYASTGISVGEYIRKRRLSEASKELTNSTKPIKQIASDYGFDSQAAFTRSFKSFCGYTPGKLRSDRITLTCFNALTNLNTRGRKMLSPKFVHRDSFRVIGLCRSFTMNNNSIPSLWDKFSQSCDQLPGVINPKTAYGICYSEETDMTADTPFFYIAGMEVSLDAVVPADFHEKSIPEADYAVFEHIGSLDTLQQTYKAIYNEWLPSSGYQRMNDYDIELYDERFKYGAPDSVFEIWIPIQKN